MKTLVIAVLGLLLVVGLMIVPDRKSTRLNSSHLVISYAVFCLKKKKNDHPLHRTNLEGEVLVGSAVLRGLDPAQRGGVRQRCSRDFEVRRRVTHTGGERGVNLDR